MPIPRDRAPARAGNVSYTYDAAGRLLAAYDGNGNVTNYQYDKADNITAILTSSASSELVFGYSPDYEVPGTNVTIYGNNFGSNPQVSYLGQQGTIVSASTTQIVASFSMTCIPICQLGPITVTSSTGTAIGPNF